MHVTIFLILQIFFAVFDNVCKILFDCNSGDIKSIRFGQECTRFYAFIRPVYNFPVSIFLGKTISFTTEVSSDSIIRMNIPIFHLKKKWNLQRTVAQYQDSGVLESCENISYTLELIIMFCMVHFY